MNHILEKFAREYIITNIALLPEGHQKRFKQLYGRTAGLKSGVRSMEETLETPIEDIIDTMPTEKLDWAMIQIENSLKKLGALEK